MPYRLFFCAKELKTITLKSDLAAVFQKNSAVHDAEDTNGDADDETQNAGYESGHAGACHGFENFFHLDLLYAGVKSFTGPPLSSAGSDAVFCRIPFFTLSIIRAFL